MARSLAADGALAQASDGLGSRMRWRRAWPCRWRLGSSQRLAGKPDAMAKRMALVWGTMALRLPGHPRAYYRPPTPTRHPPAQDAKTSRERARSGGGSEVVAAAERTRMKSAPLRCAWRTLPPRPTLTRASCEVQIACHGKGWPTVPCPPLLLLLGGSAAGPALPVMPTPPIPKPTPMDECAPALALPRRFTMPIPNPDLPTSTPLRARRSWLSAVLGWATG